VKNKGILMARLPVEFSLLVMFQGSKIAQLILTLVKWALGSDSSFTILDEPPHFNK